ncbi:hypothetical protein TIFTF001_011732 [Ficus carica]|uniref:Uncharacterized protein n=1 Tax=Ficus carica TaxID=3494 RepID=A0AA88D344_FICCA|nr:hypothetical protein TIFTF001_011732 [Ficus carica]
MAPIKRKGSEESIDCFRGGSPHEPVGPVPAAAKVKAPAKEIGSGHCGSVKENRSPASQDREREGRSGDRERGSHREGRVLSREWEGEGGSGKIER